MAEHPIFGGELRPGQQRYARMMGGMASPLWLPFMAAASVGATWWMMHNWSRLAAGARTHGADAQGQARGETPAPQVQPEAQARSGQARSFNPDVSAPLTETLAVQGANDAEAPAETPARARPPASPQLKPTPTRKAAAAPKAAPRPAARASKSAAGASKPAAGAKAPSTPQPSAPRAKGDRAVDRPPAAAAHPKPELPPHEGLPSRKKGKGKKTG